MVGSCPKCSSKIDAVVDFSSKKGFAQKVLLSCENVSDCGWSFSTYTSKSLNADECNRYDVNIRSIVAFREIGRGLSHIETFNRVMNMPPPFSHSTYDDTIKDILPHYVAAMNDSMLNAADNVKLQATNAEDNIINEPPPQVDDIFDCVIIDNIINDVSLDGSWRRRGYASLNGFISAIERVSDKVVDIDVMTKDCRSCKHWNGKEKEPEYEKWLMTHDCLINHEGSSGSMETEGAVRIFNRSLEKNGLRYINYIGDGDSSAYKRVLVSNPYNDVPIGKLECVGHIQKRVGADLLTLVKENKGISDRCEGKLTHKVINTLQNYYGTAIRNNKNTSLPQVKIAIAAVLHHCVQKSGEDKDDRHKYCTQDNETWCKYQKSKLEGSEFKGDRINISEPIYKLIRPLWLRLSESSLLVKCLHGRTQNVNEAFNAFVWKRAPKDVFVGRNVLDISVASAVVAFNDGASGVLKIMGNIGLHIGHFNMKASLGADVLRISAVRYKSTGRVQTRRKKLHAKKKGYTKVDDKDYGAGMH